MSSKQEPGNAPGGPKNLGARGRWQSWRSRVLDPLAEVLRKPSPTRRMLLVVGLFLIMFRAGGGQYGAGRRRLASGGCSLPGRAGPA